VHPIRFWLKLRWGSSRCSIGHPTWILGVTLSEGTKCRGERRKRVKGRVRVRDGKKEERKLREGNIETKGECGRGGEGKG